MVLVRKRRTKSFRVSESSEVGNVRRTAVYTAQNLGFDETTCGKVAIVATELGTNLVRHVNGGTILLNSVENGTDNILEIIAIDKGPGIHNLDRCMEDGFSTSTTPGNGLGAVRRQATEFDVFTHPSLGTAILASFCPTVNPSMKRPFYVGGICLPIRGEIEVGDGWDVIETPHSLKLVLADGLGHGPLAAEAANQAIQIFQNAQNFPLTAMLEKMHLALRKTRGAAVAALEIDIQNQRLNFAGVGNISASLCSFQGQKGVASANGTIGHHVGKLSEYSYPWSVDKSLIAHSDGLQTRWDLKKGAYYETLLQHHPSVIAAVLYRDFHRENDDCTVAVVKQCRPFGGLSG